MTTLGLQGLTVAAIVAACLAYAVWTLMPAALRRRAAEALLAAAPWPRALAARLARAARAGGGCGCDGCDVGAKAGPRGPSSSSTAKPIVFHPRPRR